MHYITHLYAMRCCVQYVPPGSAGVGTARTSVAVKHVTQSLAVRRASTLMLAS